jgi:hypothetical protein
MNTDIKLKNLIKLSIDESSRIPLIIGCHSNMMELFSKDSLDESNSDLQKDVIDAIKTGDWETPNASTYRTAYYDNSKHKKMLTNYSTSELGKMKLFKLKGYDIGYALKKRNGKFSEIVAVFNNEPDVKGIGEDLVKSAIRNGGCYLDHYDGFLTGLYSKLGFIEYDRYAFDPQYDPDGSFRKQYGEKDVIFRKHRNCK